VIRYKIKENTDEGRLVTPMYRQQYSYSDSPMFDDWHGYGSMEEAHEAIQVFERTEKTRLYEHLVILPFWMPAK